MPFTPRYLVAAALAAVVLLLVGFVAGVAAASSTVEPDRIRTEALAPLSPNLFGAETDVAAKIIQAKEFADAAAFAQLLSALDAARTTQIAGSGGGGEVPVLRSSPGPASSNGAFLDCVRQRESNGQYAVKTNPAYRGAYQFGYGTWDNTAEHAGRPDLIGMDPADASPADQDAMAQTLLAWQGTGPWAGGNYAC